MKKPKWARKLTKKDLQHVADAGPTGRPSLRVAKLNANNPHCFDCRHLARKAGLV
jgi:hypothetical protein